MKDYFPTKPFDYAAFVDEITDLVEVGETLHERHSASEGFRRWQHELQDLINRTRRIGYPVNCGVAQRHFSSDFSDLADNPVELNSTAFERDMADTLMELRLIIANFRKYGAPETSAQILVRKGKVQKSEVAEVGQAPAAAPLALPEKVTIPWLWHNVPVPLMGGAVVSVIAVFVAGVTVGGTKAGQKAMEWLSPAASSPVVVAAPMAAQPSTATPVAPEDSASAEHKKAPTSFAEQVVTAAPAHKHASGAIVNEPAENAIAHTPPAATSSVQR